MELESCVVRVESEDGSIIGGTGFVIGPTLVVTCAHVVEVCGAGAGQWIRLIFQVEGSSVEAKVLADGWHPAADIAFLRLVKPLPEGIIPAVLKSSIGQKRTQVRAFGYPKVGKVEGLWGSGEVIGSVTKVGRSLLQLRSTQITVGFSGGPVWEEETRRVIGMITQITKPDRYDRLGNVAFAIPAEALYNLCSDDVSLQSTDETLSTLYKYDAFISYNVSSDKDWVCNWLVPKLDSCGLKICIEYRDFIHSVARATNIEQAIQHSRYILPVLTPDYLNSDWATFENAIIRVLDPISRTQRIIPLVLKPCIACFSHVDSI